MADKPTDVLDDPVMKALAAARPAIPDVDLAPGARGARRILDAVTAGGPPRNSSVRSLRTAPHLRRPRPALARPTRRALIALAAAAVVALAVVLPLRAGQSGGRSGTPAPSGRLVPLADSLLVSPGWSATCCTIRYPETSRIVITTVDAGSGATSTIEPFPAVSGLSVPWLAIGRYVVALVYPPKAFYTSALAEAYAFQPAVGSARALGPSTAIVAAADGDGVWLEPQPPGNGEQCIEVREVSVTGVVLQGDLQLPCGAQLEGALPGGLLLDFGLTGSTEFAQRYELWDPSTRQVVWSRNETLYPAELGQRYMLYPAEPCVPGQCTDMLVSDLETGATHQVVLGTPLPAFHGGAIGPLGPTTASFSIVLFSPTAPAEMAMVEGAASSTRKGAVVTGTLRVVDLTTGRVVLSRSLSFPAESYACHPSVVPPCPAIGGEGMTGGGLLPSNPTVPYVSWSWGGSYLLIGSGDHLLAYSMSSATAAPTAVSASPNSLVVEGP